MYFATLTEIPILQAPMRMGLNQGPALSFPNIIVIARVKGWKKTVVFVVVIVMVSTSPGLGYSCLVG